MYNILFVEDEISMVDTVKFQLRKTANISSVGTIKEAFIKLFENPKYDLLILDENLPDGKGIEFLNTLKSNSKYQHIKSEAIILTGDKEISKKVKAFDLGAQDYILKPIEPQEFKARVNSKLKLLEEKDKSNDLLVGNLKLNLSHRKVEILKDEGAVRVSLTPKEFDILWFFANDVDKFFDRKIIMKEVWDGLNVSSRTIDSHISKIKTKILGSKFTFIGGYNKGYKLTDNLN